MNNRQTYILDKAKEKIQELRWLLDDVMYHTGDISDKYYNRIREAYNLVCEANDKLP